MLEIGTGPGTFSRELAPRCGSYLGVEYDQETLLAARERTGGKAEIIQADARCLPFEENRFSFVVCLEVLEHLGDFEAGVKSLRHCLRPEGIAIISVPYRRIGGKSLTNEHHPYEPGEAELVASFQRLFSNVEVYYQFFYEPSWLSLARTFHLRRVLGLVQCYADLTAGLPSATSRLKISRQSHGWNLNLLLAATGKKPIASSR